MPPPLRILLEFTRSEKAADPYAFRLAPQTYLLRKEGGGFESTTLAWGEDLLRDLAALSREGVDPSAVQRVGDQLRVFLEPTGWEREEAAIVSAVKAGQCVHLTIRSAAAELYALPWELLTLRASGQHLGELGGVLIRYEWPKTQTAPEEPSPRNKGGRILLAWSAAGGVVPAKEHIDALQRSCAERSRVFDPRKDVLSHVSYGRLADTLDAASKGDPIAVLHILCHGAAEGQTFGLAWSGDGSSDEKVVVDAGRLRQLLAQHAGRVRLVVLSACDSANSGALGNHLGSVAQTLHRAGIQAVVASRFPLSGAGSVRLASAFYAALMGELSSVESAFLAARAALARDPARYDWASLMLYARGDDEAETRPVVIRPYRGLLAFKSRHTPFFRGRDAEREALKRRVEEAAKGERPRFQVIAGASGSGKTSLVMAGLIPDLTSGSAGWDVVKLRPASLGGALSTLWKKLRALPEPSVKDSEEESAPTTVTPRDIEEESRRFRSIRPGRPLLLLVDQFEELFAPSLEGRERDALVQALWLLSRSPELSIVVLITIRVELLGRCGEIVVDEASSRKRLDRVVYDPDHTYYLVQIDAKHLREIIEEPARKVGLAIEAGLTDVILDDVGDDTGVLPLLEYALDELWKRRAQERLTQDAYRQMGSFKGALVQTADQILDKMSAAEKTQAHRLLVRMVNPAETGSADTRCRAWIAQARPVDPVDAAHFNRALDKLVRGRLLVIGDDDPLDPEAGDWAELAHDALIRSWGRLRAWVVEDREMLRQLANLKRASEEWATRKSGANAEEYLLRQTRLALALDVQEKYGLEIDPEVRAFIEASRRAEEREHHEATWRRRWTLARGAGAVAFLGAMALHAFVTLRMRAAASVEADRADAAEARFEAEHALAQAETGRAEDAARLSIALGNATTDPTLSAVVLREMTHAASTPAFLSLGHKLAEQPLARAVLRGHDDRVFSVQWSRDGRRILTASADGSIQVRSADDSGWPIVLKHDGPLLSALFSPDERRIVSCSFDRTARIWDAAGVGAPLVLEHGATVYSVVWSPDGERVLTASADGAARIFRADGIGAPVVLKHGAAVYTAAWSSDGARVLTASADNAARIFRADGTGAPVVLKHDAAVYAAAFSPDGKRVATASLDATARIYGADGAGKPIVFKQEDALSAVTWSPDGTRILLRSMSGRSARALPIDSDGERKPVVISHDGIVVSAGFSPDGRQILTTSVDMTARMTRADGLGKPLILGHSTAVFSAAWSADGRHVATGAQDGVVRIWAPDSVGRRITLKLDGPVHIAAWSPDGRRIVTAGDDGTARVFRADGAGAAVVLKHDQGVGFAAWSPDGSRVVTLSADRIARVFRADGGGRPVLFAPDAPTYSRASLNEGSPKEAPEPIAAFASPKGPAWTAAWSPDSSRIVTASIAGVAWIFQADGQGKPVALPRAAAVTSARWSPDGGRVVTTFADGSAFIYRADGLGAPISLQHVSRVFDAQWSPDGQRIATAASQEVRLFRAEDGALLGSRQARFGFVVAVAWSPDTKRLLGLLALDDEGSRRADRMTVWDAEDSAAQIVLGGSAGSILSAEWSPNSERIVAAASDGAARVFRAKDGALLFELRAGLARMEFAGWSPDGTSIVTAGGDGTAQVVPVDGAALMSFLWSATSWCLPPRERVRLLGDDDGAARWGHEGCLARVRSGQGAAVPR
jgi:WD40 repeat protein/energy-coupling factor transporter ATP-binding protein EcfA2